MTFTQPTTKSNGSTITVADMNTYVRDNIAHFRNLPTVKVDADDDSLVDSTASDILLSDAVSDPVEVWDTDSLHTGAGYLEFDSPEGMWYAGGTLTFDEDSTGDRRFEIRRADDSRNLARWRTRTNDQRTVRMSAGTAHEFDATDSLMNVRALQTSGGNLGANGSLWGLWLADDAVSGLSPDNLALTSSQGVLAWWNQWVDNIARLHRRPSARVRLATDYTTLGDNTWTKVPFDTQMFDNAVMVDSDESVITAQHTGWYYCSACILVDGFTGTADQVAIQFRVDGDTTNTGGASRSYDVAAGDGSVIHEAFVYLVDGEELTTYAFKGTTGGNSTILAGHMTHMSATLVSGAVAAPNRQYFLDDVPDTPSFSQPESNYLPRGLANVCTRDLFAHLWNPLLLGIDIPDDEEESLSGGGWSDIALRGWRGASWPIIDTDTPPGGRIEVPHDGLWWVVGYVELAGNDVGSIGDRGVRIKHNNKNLSPIRTKAAEQNGHSWAKSTSALVNARRGHTIGLQGLNSTDDEVDVTAAHLTAVWMRDRVT